MTSFEKDKELIIRDLGIFELRGLARQFGVSSPTTRKRDELIECILQSMENKDSKEQVGKRKGRPFKQLSSIKDIFNTVVEEDCPFDNLSYNSMLGFAQVAVDFDFSEKFAGEMKQFCGYARVKDGKVSFIDSEKNVWVFIKDQTKYSELVKNGDKILVNGYATNSRNQFVGTEICELNDVKIQDYQLTEASHGFEVISNNVLPYGANYLKEGRRNSFCLNDDLYENDNLKNAYKYCLAKDIDFILLGANVSFEDSIYFSKLDKAKNFTTKYGANQTINLNKILDAINYATQRLQNGKNVFFVVADILEIVRVLDKVLTFEIENREEMKKIVVTELLSLAKAYEDGCTCTMLVCYRKNDYDNEYLHNEILRICKEI